MIAWLLFQKIAELFLILASGFMLVKLKLLKSSDSRYLSLVLLYLINPCVLITSFQLEISRERLLAMLFSLGAAVLAHGIMILLNLLLRRLLRLTRAEQASCIYSNCVNLLIPVIGSVLGREWVPFTSMYMVVMVSLTWSHGRMLLSGESGISFRKIFGNLNIICIFIGLALCLMQIRLPSLLAGAMESIGGMLGPVSMIITGMLIGGADLKRIIRMPGVWKVVCLRLLAYPIIILLIFKFSGLANLVPDGTGILLVSLLAAAAPSATVIVQMAQLYSDDGEYASAINVIATLLCIVTMPLIIMLYQM